MYAGMAMHIVIETAYIKAYSNKKMKELSEVDTGV